MVEPQTDHVVLDLNPRGHIVQDLTRDLLVVRGHAAQRGPAVERRDQAVHGAGGGIL